MTTLDEDVFIFMITLRSNLVRTKSASDRRCRENQNKYFMLKKLLLNQTDASISQIYFFNKILHVSDSSSIHHQEFFTVHTTMVFVIQVC